MQIKNYGDFLGEGRFVLHSQFNNVANFTNGTEIVSLVTCEVGAGPTNIVLSSLERGLTEIHISSRNHTLCLGSREINLGSSQKFSSEFTPEKPVGSANSYAGMQDFSSLTERISFLKSSLPGLVKRESLAYMLFKPDPSLAGEGLAGKIFETLAAGATLMASRAFLEGVQLLKGLGFGLTPSGDDFICGYLSGLRTLEVMKNTSYLEMRGLIREQGLGNSLLSNSFINQAYAGRFSEKFLNFLRSFCFRSADDLLKCTKHVLAMGDSSGADLVSGFLLCLEKEYIS